MQVKEFFSKHKQTIVVVVISGAIGAGIGYKVGHRPQPDVQLTTSKTTTSETKTTATATQATATKVDEAKANDKVKVVYVIKKVTTTKPDGTVIHEETDTHTDFKDKSKVDTHVQSQDNVQVAVQQEQKVQTVEKLVYVQKNTLPQWEVGAGMRWDSWKIAAPDRFEFEADYRIAQVKDMGVYVGGSLDTKFNPGVNVRLTFP